MTGPDYRGTVLTLLITLTIFAAEMVVSFPWLLMHRWGVGVVLLVLVSFVLTVWAAFLSSTTDPVIIPRAIVAAECGERAVDSRTENYVQWKTCHG